MKKQRKYISVICWVMAYIFILSGCAHDSSIKEADSLNGNGQEEGAEISNVASEQMVELCKEEDSQDLVSEPDIEETSRNAVSGSEDEDLPYDAVAESEVIETDWSEYFDGLHGAAVVYDVSASRYMIYDRELAMTRRSPCSTFKIISSMIALENGIIEPEDSTHTWSGEIFWNEKWNKDIAFDEAFHESCVWYFREIIDEIGPEMVQEGLDRLQYGNCDISDWEGRLNTNNNNRALTGFWIESSLEISPKEQTEVMERIFGPDSVCSEKTRNELKKVMLVTEPVKTDIPIYGKTGMGKTEGIVVDAWFTGFAESAEGNIYFCVYLGRTDDRNVSSTVAKEIAIRIVEDYCK